MVQGINTGRYWYMDNETYPLQKYHKANSYYKSNNINIAPPKEYRCKICGQKISSKSTYCLSCYQKISRKVERPSKEELYSTLVKLQGNFTQVSKIYNVSDNAVRKWCISYNIPSKSKEYKTISQYIPPIRSTKPKPIIQYDLQNNIINIYISSQEAARAIQKPNGSSHILAVCNGKRKTAYGYKWKFQND